MAFPNGSDMKDMTFGKEWDAEKMLRLSIHNYMKKKGLHGVADIFVKEANLEMHSFVDSEEGLLKEWWESFWPQFSSKLGNQARGNSQSLAQPSMQDALVMLGSVKKQEATSSQDIPVGNPQLNMIPTPLFNQQIFASGDSSVVNVMGQPPVGLLPTSPVINQHRAGKLPVDTNIDDTLGESFAQAIRKGPLGFPPVKLLQTQLSLDVVQMACTTPPPSGNSSNLHVPVTTPVQVTADPSIDVVAERFDQKQ